MTVPQRVSVYDRIRPHLDASSLIQRLGLELVRTLGPEAYCRPLCHDSTSGESLQINLQTGRWNCKACQSLGIYGDLFQLVEYVLTGGGAPTRGNAQSASDGHREALVWLCDQFGIPFDENRMTGDPGLDVIHMVAMEAHQHLLQRPDVLKFIADKWGFDRDTVESYGLGFLPSPMLPSLAAEAKRHGSRNAFRASGLGWFAPEGDWRTRFEGRVTFPYLEHGRSVYLIGRATDSTPLLDGGRRPPKYHKLSVHSDERPYISERVTNDHLYNETVMMSADEIGVVEGVADAVAISSLGVPVVSPVTISFNAVDLERFLSKCHENGIGRVWILFDNELSGSGNWAARRTALKLVEGGLVVKILTLPLGDAQMRARDEVLTALGPELFEELERSDPRRRKEIIADAVPDESRRSWVIENVELSKIDAAEWTASEGAGAAGKFNAIRRDGRDVIGLEVDDVAASIDPLDDAVTRAAAFDPIIHIVAHVRDRLAREGYAGIIAKAAGKDVTKVEIARRIAAYRRDSVTPKRKQAESEAKVDQSQAQRELVLLPPETEHTRTPAPSPPPKKPGDKPAAPAPPPPGGRIESAHERYASARDSVANAVASKLPEEPLGEFVAQTIMRSMGFTPFRTPDELYLVRGGERIPVGLSRRTPAFGDLLWLASGLTPVKSQHGAYIAAAVYFLGRDARRVDDVSWSYVDRSRDVFFPMGDDAGRMIKIALDGVGRTKMSEVRVPAVAGDEFAPFEYTEDEGGIARALDIFRWTSIAFGDRLILVYWIVCLPVLRRIGTIPIVRIEGGSGSGKTRAVDAVSYLVNGRKSSSVPTAAALASRMSREMLTVDDNREADDVSPAFLSTLLQATHLGAKEKRKANSDTGTVVERICGALLMNGVEPIHSGKSEVASRMIILRSSARFRVAGSPSSDDALASPMIECRNAFWSEAVRRCSAALSLDAVYGESLGAEIEEIFGATKIGRLSTYLRLMYLAWTVGLPEETRQPALEHVSEIWRTPFADIAAGSLESLLKEELAVSVLRYVFAYAESLAEAPHKGSDELVALDGKYVKDVARGDAYLGPLRATHLARLARTAAKEMNAPRAIASDLRAGQLEHRLIDGLEFLEAAGFAVEVERTNRGRYRFSFMRAGRAAPAEGRQDGDTWEGPGDAL